VVCLKNAVFYFTGTGNSYIIAKQLSDLLDAQLISIASYIKEKRDTLSFDTIGIVYPIYYANIPNIIREFCKNYNFKNTSYVYAVCNYGGGKGEAIKTTRDILKMNGISLSASFGMQMPQNAFLKKYENMEKVLNAAEKMIRQISSIVAEQKEGFYSQNRLLDLIANSLLFMINPVVKHHLIKMSGLEKGNSLEQAIYKLDGSFKANSSCTGCGICAAVCPVDNIKMNGGIPEWHHRCENCLACVNFCPVNAIENEITNKGFRYLHPEYSLQQAMKQKKVNVSI
jgi:ferredoxin